LPILRLQKWHSDNIDFDLPLITLCGDEICASFASGVGDFATVGTDCAFIRYGSEAVIRSAVAEGT
jgi:hypothetical protein